MARVLLVEDEPNIASIIVFKLAREGHQVRWEASAVAVLAAAEATDPELVLLDSSLPDGDPFSLLAERSPVVMMTEFRDTATPLRARAAGAGATLGKPFKPTQLARLVAQLVPASAAGRP
jgi:two-component system response regulator VicR